MTFTVFALENTPARLCAKRMTTNCEATADMIAEGWADMGYIITRECEG